MAALRRPRLRRSRHRRPPRRLQGRLHQRPLTVRPRPPHHRLGPCRRRLRPPGRHRPRCPHPSHSPAVHVPTRTACTGCYNSADWRPRAPHAAQTRGVNARCQRKLGCRGLQSECRQGLCRRKVAMSRRSRLSRLSRLVQAQGSDAVVPGGGPPTELSGCSPSTSASSPPAPSDRASSPLPSEPSTPEPSESDSPEDDAGAWQNAHGLLAPVKSHTGRDPRLRRHANGRRPWVST
jgi:hypothetical protein